MPTSKRRVILGCLFVTLVVAVAGYATRSTSSAQTSLPPRTFEDGAVRSVQTPLAVRAASPVQMSEDAYYRIPVAPIYRSYPVYAPGREPAGYFESLQQREPEVAFDAATLKTTEDWIRAGELVFDAPIAYGTVTGLNLSPEFSGEKLHQYLRDPRWYRRTGAPLAADGSLPFYRYVVRERGKLEVGVLSCGMCHTRVMADGTVIKGAQGNFPIHRAVADDYSKVADAGTVRALERLLYSAPWLTPDSYPDIEGRSISSIIALHEAIPPGVVARHGSNPLVPTKVPDLIGIADRRYLDATGLVHHRDITDLMRYAAMNQTTDLFASHGGFVPGEALFGEIARDPVRFAQQTGAGRYSDEQLYALARYLYSLKPPPNPNRPSALSRRGAIVFGKQGCAGCHTPPLYTNNRLTPAQGFVPPDGAVETSDVMRLSVGTDADLALRTRRGTGYYKVPSLKGVWYRGPFGHSGWVTTLEEWLDPARLRDDYVRSGFNGRGSEAHPVEGHRFGLTLSAADKRALMAFLRTL